MKDQEIYLIMKSTVKQLAESHEELSPLEGALERDKHLVEYGFDILSFSELARELEVRFDGRKLDLETFFVPEVFNMATLGQVFDRIRNKTAPAPATGEPVVVYVDDEEQNLFVFRRKFSKELNLKTFSDPYEALNYVAKTPAVRLVITDEVMPGLRGNQLCDEVRKVKPNVRFILITGNPENDDGLMYKTLRHNRFFEFLQKPINFDERREEFVALIKDLLSRVD